MMDRQPRPAPMPAPQPPPVANRRPPAPKRRRGRVRRFFRGYLMIAGALATAYVLGMLLVRLFVEIYKWLAPLAGS